jgi:hypothetical protein
MIIREEISKEDFANRAWSGAVNTVNSLTSDEFEQVFNMLEDENPDGMELTELNDFFWFETDMIAEWLGFEDWEDLEAKHQAECEEIAAR